MWCNSYVLLINMDWSMQISNWYVVIWCIRWYFHDSNHEASVKGCLVFSIACLDRDQIDGGLEGREIP